MSRQRDENVKMLWGLQGAWIHRQSELTYQAARASSRLSCFQSPGGKGLVV